LVCQLVSYVYFWRVPSGFRNAARCTMHITIRPCSQAGARWQVDNPREIRTEISIRTGAIYTITYFLFWCWIKIPRVALKMTSISPYHTFMTFFYGMCPCSMTTDYVIVVHLCRRRALLDVTTSVCIKLFMSYPFYRFPCCVINPVHDHAEMPLHLLPCKKTLACGRQTIQLWRHCRITAWLIEYTIHC